MAKAITTILVLFVLLSACRSQIAKTDLQVLNGYWEIEKVTFPNGTHKSFTVNPVIDYIEVSSELTGFRKKVHPKFDGTYTTSNDATHFAIVPIEAGFQIQYKEASGIRMESLIHITNTQFSVVNSEEITYTYKRFHPITVSK